MQLIRHRVFARAGLIGNPSDGYHGKTISLIVRNFRAELVLYEWEDVEIVLTSQSQSRFDSVRGLVQDVRLHGYYGGIRLVKAAIKKFVEYCDRRGHKLHDRNFAVRFDTNIPRQVGLAGSSALIAATLRCLMEFYNVRIPLQVQPSLVLAVETEELGLPAGLQDRVIQVYEGLVYMDFAADKMTRLHGFECGVYEPLDPASLPPLYVAYDEKAAEPTEAPHSNLRARYKSGEPLVVQAMAKFADITVQARQALEDQDFAAFRRLIDANFDLRRSIQPISDRQLHLVQAARRTGATAKFAGSGGAIIGTYDDEAMYDRLERQLGAIDCRVFKPIVDARSG